MRIPEAFDFKLIRCSKSLTSNSLCTSLFEVFDFEFTMYGVCNSIHSDEIVAMRVAGVTNSRHSGPKLETSDSAVFC